VRKWTKSACVVIAWCTLAILAVVGSRGPGQPAQAPISIANSAQPTLASAPATLMTVITAPAAATTVASATVITVASATTAPVATAATWAVRPGDTLSAVASALAVPGGWQALYAANRRVIGPDPDVIRPGTVLTLPGKEKPARYTVAPGDTLSGIAAALALTGGWQALYAANRRVIGPDPDVIRPGTILVAPHQAPAGQPAPAMPGQQPPASSAPSSASGQTPAAAPSGPAQTPATAPGGTASAGQDATGSGATSAGTGSTSSGAHSTASSGAMPRWLKDILLAAALLTVIAFITEPVLVLTRRRRRARAAAPPVVAAPPAAGAEPSGGPRDLSPLAGVQADLIPAGPAEAGPAPDDCPAADCGQHVAERAARIVQADYERLVVTYSMRDDVVYLLTPPKEDPRAVLRAARLVLPEDTYEELAGHLGVPSRWPLE
jgi:LysM repeat protein